MRSRRFLSLITVALLTGAAACSDSSSPPDDTTRPPGDLNVVRLASTSPPLFNAEESFYAVQGEDREIRIYFQEGLGGQGEEFFRLRIRRDALLARPDGTPIAPGDSVLITARVVDPASILFELEPSGLTFNPDEPAELKIHYNHADHDFNRDGTIDISDDQIKSRLAIWRQELPDDSFVRLGSVNIEDFEEINADILGFSRYAIAY